MTEATDTYTPHDPVQLEARELELWRGDRCLFSGLSFSLATPVLHVRGANGSGKTTLLKLLCGLTTAEHGAVEWRRAQERCTPAEARGWLAYAGHLDGLNPMLTSRENLQWGAGLYHACDTQAITSIAERHGLTHLLPLPARSLSAGQRRRVTLLRSVLSDVPVWVWDEPYANLDAQGVAWVNGLLSAHVKRGGCAILSAHQVPGVAPELITMLELGT